MNWLLKWSKCVYSFYLFIKVETKAIMPSCHIKFIMKNSHPLFLFPSPRPSPPRLPLSIILTVSPGILFVFTFLLLLYFFFKATYIYVPLFSSFPDSQFYDTTCVIKSELFLFVLFTAETDHALWLYFGSYANSLSFVWLEVITICFLCSQVNSFF